MKTEKQPKPPSLDDCLIQIHRELQKVNAAVNDRRWSSALAGLDHITEFANAAFSHVGKMPDAPKVD